MDALEKDSSPLELGWPIITLSVKDLTAAEAWYSSIGFKSVERDARGQWASIASGNAELFLTESFGPAEALGPKTVMFAGADVVALVEELRAREIPIHHFAPGAKMLFPPSYFLAEDGSALPVEGTGACSVSDLDGNWIQFFTQPADRQRHARGASFASDAVHGGWSDDEIVLGRFTYCLDIANIELSLDFYQRLGLKVVSDNAADGWAILRPEDPVRASIGLFQGHIDGNLLNFRGGDVFALGHAFKRQGIVPFHGPEIEDDGSAGLWLRDPDGHVMYFNTAPGEEIAAGPEGD
jgi:catechol 2,3-dioxygenase-like lactoylglutathione lyase family enzyme